MRELNTFTRHKRMMNAASLIQVTFGHYSRASVGFFLFGYIGFVFLFLQARIGSVVAQHPLLTFTLDHDELLVAIFISK